MSLCPTNMSLSETGSVSDSQLSGPLHCIILPDIAWYRLRNDKGNIIEAKNILETCTKHVNNNTLRPILLVVFVAFREANVPWLKSPCDVDPP